MYKCVLIVDDDNTTNLLNNIIIKSSGSFENIIIKNDGFYALEYLQDYTNKDFIIPDLILLDLNMPIMNGWEFIDHFEKLPKKITSKIKLIILSASANILDQKKAKTINVVTAFKRKPFTRDTLNDILKNYM